MPDMQSSKGILCHTFSMAVFWLQSVHERLVVELSICDIKSLLKKVHILEYFRLEVFLTRDNRYVLLNHQIYPLTLVTTLPNWDSALGRATLRYSCSNPAVPTGTCYLSVQLRRCGRDHARGGMHGKQRGRWRRLLQDGVPQPRVHRIRLVPVSRTDLPDDGACGGKAAVDFPDP